MAADARVPAENRSLVAQYPNIIDFIGENGAPPWIKITNTNRRLHYLRAVSDRQAAHNAAVTAFDHYGRGSSGLRQGGGHIDLLSGDLSVPSPASHGLDVI